MCYWKSLIIIKHSVFVFLKGVNYLVWLLLSGVYYAADFWSLEVAGWCGETLGEICFWQGFKIPKTTVIYIVKIEFGVFRSKIKNLVKLNGRETFPEDYLLDSGHVFMKFLYW